MQKRKHMAAHAYEQSCFYQMKAAQAGIDPGSAAFTELPIVHKQDIVDGPPIESMDYIMGRIPEQDIGHMNTSGSTGVCLPVLWEKKDYVRSLLPLWILRKRYYGIHPQDRLCYFYTIDGQEGQETAFVQRENQLGFSKSRLGDERLKEIYQQMLEFQPKWMMLQPCMGELLVETAKKHHLPPIPDLKYIEFSGEMLFDTCRQKVKDFFQCQISNQYGSYEVNSIALECPEGNLHCLSGNVHVEVVDDEEQPVETGVEGKIIVTSLQNHVMPFVRYDIGDRGRILWSGSDGRRCTCTNPNPIIQLTVGRSTDYILTEEGETFNPYIFVRAIEILNHRFEEVIQQFQFLQTAYSKFQVHLRLDDNCLQNQIADMLPKLIEEPGLQDAEYEIVFHDEFMNHDGRKLRYFQRMF